MNLPENKGIAIVPYLFKDEKGDTAHPSILLTAKTHGLYFLPGGKIRGEEGDKDTIDTVIRRLKEDTHLVVTHDSVRPIFVRQIGGYIYDVYFAPASGIISYEQGKYLGFYFPDRADGTPAEMIDDISQKLLEEFNKYKHQFSGVYGSIQLNPTIVKLWQASIASDQTPMQDPLEKLRKLFKESLGKERLN